MDREYHQKVAKKFESSLVFPEQINRLWRLLKDKSKLLYICCSINLIYFLESGKTGLIPDSENLPDSVPDSTGFGYRIGTGLRPDSTGFEPDSDRIRKPTGFFFKILNKSK